MEQLNDRLAKVSCLGNNQADKNTYDDDKSPKSTAPIVKVNISIVDDKSGQVLCSTSGTCPPLNNEPCAHVQSPSSFGRSHVAPPCIALDRRKRFPRC